MTSEQIIKKIYGDQDEALWEIAYQLAVQNERQERIHEFVNVPVAAPELGSGVGVGVDEYNRELNGLGNPICWRCGKPTTETYHGLCGTCFKVTKESWTRFREVPPEGEMKSENRLPARSTERAAGGCAPSTLVAEFRRLRDRVEFLEATSDPIHADETPEAPKPTPEGKKDDDYPEVMGS